MVGGYLSFQGIEAKANYRNTPSQRCYLYAWSRETTARKHRRASNPV